MSRLFMTTLLVVCGLFPATLIAVTEPARPVVSPVATLGKLALALTFVLCVFWVFARVMKRFNGFQGVNAQDLKIVAALSLGQRERVVVVQAGAQQLVLGVTASQINTLHVLEKPIERSDIRAQADFKDKLSDAMKKRMEQ